MNVVGLWLMQQITLSYSNLTAITIYCSYVLKFSRIGCFNIIKVILSRINPYTEIRNTHVLKQNRTPDLIKFYIFVFSFSSAAIQLVVNLLPCNNFKANA